MLFVSAKVLRSLLPFISKKARERLARKFLSEDYVQAGEMEDTYKCLIGEDRQKEFASLSLPVSMIWGEGDEATPLSQATRLKASRPQTVLETIPAAGHYCFLDQPEKFKSIISRFL